jgi:hypothetical protein
LFARIMLAIWGVIMLSSVGYAMVFVHPYLQEPAPAAAKIIRKEWDQKFSCGPAYVLGQGHAAHGVGLYFGRSVIGAGDQYYLHARWIDRARLQKLGAVIITTPGAGEIPNVEKEFPRPAEPAVIRLTYRRTFHAREHVYLYWFVPPRSC